MAVRVEFTSKFFRYIAVLMNVWFVKLLMRICFGMPVGIWSGENTWWQLFSKTGGVKEKKVGSDDVVLCAKVAPLEPRCLY